jgi:aerobic carbon-monoxide dehydrogenase small subunit
MRPVNLIVNGDAISEVVEARTHLADFLRDRLTLTATHLRCEQGVCGACTVLIDGQPARSCITYVGLCENAEVTTLEGLENDPIVATLRHAFSVEHGLQCGYCTPGMLITARDIVLRLPDADDERIRLELSGNLCRCTGYVGIVRSIGRVLQQRREGELKKFQRTDAPLGPVGARPAEPRSTARETSPAAASAPSRSSSGSDRVLGLAGRQPNIDVRQSFIVSHPPEEIWSFLADTARVVRCLPGASLGANTCDDRVEGAIRIKIGPIRANFSGEARIARDDVNRRGTIIGSGSDRLGSSRASGELEYVVGPARGGTRVSLAVRALLTGPLAQFGRSGIVDDLVSRIIATFSQNLEAQLRGAPLAGPEQSVLPAGSLIWQVIAGRLKRVIAKAFGKHNR